MRVTVWRSVRTLIAVFAAPGFLWFVSELSQAFAAAPPSQPANVDPARAAREVFQDQDFWWKRIEPKTISTSSFEYNLATVLDLLGRLLRAIIDPFATLFRSLFGLLTGAGSGGMIVVWLLVVAFLAGSIWKLYPVIVGWLSDGGPAPSARHAVASETLPEASLLLEQASLAFGKGMYADAIRLALLALIARLEKQGLLRYDTTRTNREYQIELRHMSELAARFGQLARIYDRVWYGRVAPDHAAAELAINLCRSVINWEGLAPE
jgi:Domain of unknown function (DUF4129)